MLGWSSTASAHTELASSDPADGATVDGDLPAVTVNLTNPAVEAGVVMAWLVVDSPGELTSGTWGRCSWRRSPWPRSLRAPAPTTTSRSVRRSTAPPDDPGLVRRGRGSLAFEAIALVVVIVLASVLVASSI
jgi:hypothetical protein